MMGRALYATTPAGFTRVQVCEPVVLRPQGGARAWLRPAQSMSRRPALAGIDAMRSAGLAPDVVAIRLLPPRARFVAAPRPVAAAGRRPGRRLHARHGDQSPHRRRRSGWRCASAPTNGCLSGPEAEAARIARDMEAALAGCITPSSMSATAASRFAVSGARAADVINSGCPLDLAPPAFPAGRATRTLLGKCRGDPGEDGRRPDVRGRMRPLLCGLRARFPARSRSRVSRPAEQFFVATHVPASRDLVARCRMATTRKRADSEHGRPRAGDGLDRAPRRQSAVDRGGDRRADPAAAQAAGHQRRRAGASGRLVGGHAVEDRERRGVGLAREPGVAGARAQRAADELLCHLRGAARLLLRARRARA